MSQFAAIQAVIERFLRTDRRGALLPLLHEIQETFGYINGNAVPLVAAALNISRAEVHGVVSFYPDFRTELPAKHVVKLCLAESCQARGSARIEAELSSQLGVAMGHTRADAKVALEPVYCLGLCAVGPNAMIDGRPMARINAAAIAEIVAEIDA